MNYTRTQPNIPILFEDDHLLIIDKPHNLLSQGDKTGDPDVVSLCKQYRQNKKDRESSFIGPVHRLDRPVGGIMMLAKTSGAASELSRQLREQRIQKTYWAVVWGHTPANGLLTHCLLKDRQKNVVETVTAQQKNAQKAELSFLRLEQTDNQSLLSVHLQTGRPHQIRVQLASEGYPVWGDYKYGKQEIPEGRTIALRSVEVIFNHPAGGEEKRLVQPPPSVHPWNQFEHKIR